MANSNQSKKRARQSENRRQHNASRRSMLRTYIKKVRLAIEAKNLEAAREAYEAALPIIDRMACKKLIHKNTAARYKSRFSIQINRLSDPAASA